MFVPSDALTVNIQKLMALLMFFQVLLWGEPGKQYGGKCYESEAERKIVCRCNPSCYDLLAFGSKSSN
jgi:hypothetical protein